MTVSVVVDVRTTHRIWPEIYEEVQRVGGYPVVIYGLGPDNAICSTAEVCADQEALKEWFRILLRRGNGTTTRFRLVGVDRCARTTV